MGFKMGEAQHGNMYVPKCWRKQSWKSKGAAEAHMRALKRSPGVKHADRLNVYECLQCKRYHVGRWIPTSELKRA